MAELELGGKRRELRLTFRSLRALEKHYGKSISKIFENEMQDESLETLVTMFWACLINDDKKLTVAKVEDMISDALDSGDLSMEDLGSHLESAVENSLIAQQGGDDAEGDDEAEAKN